MSFGVTEAAAILKEHYPFNEVAKLGHRNNKFFSIVKKDTEAGGDQEKIPVEVADIQAGSHTFATAQTVAAATSTRSGK